ncbi:sigma-70 family RNA polymerase sigma factor [Actinospica durhamensis]|uniref:Sigma-70 family RNA polymerase sigma factor n=1 Tax=Actinospica durhamensis TaxID=1508375 RepID=A0A941IKH1_9ACTN|nr:sigma-70 family RNA polymerase sigma factor [Actinospica durhamensis]MBR7831825.1 sigma-70 family RNA polymerase sigma factor [Actinospica durhamensis]
MVIDLCAGQRPPASAAHASARMRTIYHLHSAALLRTLLNWTHGDLQAAEDLMQETMVRAWRNLETLNADPQTLRPWLFTVARRIAIDRFRARVVRPLETEPEPLDEAVEPAEPYKRVLDRAIVVGALRELSEVHRTALVQVYLMDRTVPEAATALGVPEGTVKSRVHHGLRAVRAAVGCERRCLTEVVCRGACG